MRIITSTDYKYIGKEVPNSTQVGDIIKLGDFDFQIVSIRKLENGLVSLSNINYQLLCEE